MTWNERTNFKLVLHRIFTVHRQTAAQFDQNPATSFCSGEWQSTSDVLETKTEVYKLGHQRQVLKWLPLS